jgi:Flp pilus assembly protein TadD
MKNILPFMRLIHTIRTVAILFLCLGTFSLCDQAQGAPSSFSPKRSKAISYRNQGMLLQNKGDLQGAMQLFQEAQKEDPGYAEVYNDIGVLYEAQGFSSQAEEQYLKAVELDPCFASAYSNLALYYEGKRDVQQARLYWQKRIELGNPDDPWTKKAKEKLIALGEGPVSMGPASAADTGLTPMQQEARKYREEGLRLQKLGDVDTALTCYLKACEIDPHYAAIHNDIGVIYETKGLPAIAEEHYQEAIKIDPSFASAYTNLAILSENKRDLVKAKEYWQMRQQLGASDQWSEIAARRLQDIALVTGIQVPAAEEKEVLDLVDEVSMEKLVSGSGKSDAQKRAAACFAKAQTSMKQGNEMDAYKNAIDAYQNDPQNQEIQQFLFRIQKDMLSK